MTKAYKFSILFLAATCVLGVAPSVAETIVYQDHFDNDGLATNAGIGGGLDAYDRQGGPWLDNGVLDSNRSGGNDRGNILSVNAFDLTGGFRLEVDYTIDDVTTIDANRAIIGLIDRNSVPAVQDNTTYITDFLNRNLDKYGIELNLTIQNSTQGLNFADDSGGGSLSQLSNAQPITTGTHSWVLEVDAAGNWYYSIDGATATTGASTFNVARDYHFVAYMQDDLNHLRIHSVTLTRLVDPVDPVVTAFTYSPVTGDCEVSFAGNANTAYMLIGAAGLDFGSPDRDPVNLTAASATVGSLDGNRIITDSNGNATVQFNLGTTKDADFVRVEEIPAFISALQEDFLTWEFGLFIHFNMATFNERQWATGTEDPASFAPTALDCNQWIDAAVDAGMKYAVLTVKHTGGWCL